MSTVSALLLEILRCPLCEAPLDSDEEKSVLVCRGDRHEYAVVNGIPNMVVDD